MSPGSAHSLSVQCFLLCSVQLARRVLKLERINASLRQQLGTEEKDKNTLIEEVREGERDMLFPLCFTLSLYLFQLKKTKSHFELSSRPHKYLMETLQARDTRIEKLTNTNATLEKKLR